MTIREENFIHSDLDRYNGDGIYLWMDNKNTLIVHQGHLICHLVYSAQEIVTAVENQLHRCAHLSSEFTIEKQKKKFLVC